MRTWICLLMLSGFLCESLRAQHEFSKPVYPESIILDTDFGPDYDDVGAITILHAFADSGYVNILATMASSKHKNAAAALSVFNTYFKRPDIPIGVVTGQAVEIGDKQHWTDSIILRYPHSIKSNQEAYDAKILYRKLLSAQRDYSVTLVTIGFLTNLANLFESAPDSYSPLPGIELIKLKVKNLVCMAGRFPDGKEFNLVEDIASSKKVLGEWPTPVLFSGFEIGQKIKTGLPIIRNPQIQHSPVKDVFAISIPFSPEDSLGRQSWDETAVYVAIRGWQEWYDIQTGTCTIDADGTDHWNPAFPRHARLVEKQSPVMVAEKLNQLIMQQPLH